MILYLSYCEKNGLTRPEYSKKLHNMAYILLQRVLSEKGINNYELEKNKYGKPYIKGSEIYFNISHCDGACICAVDGDELGVDIENIRPAAGEKIMKRCFTDNERDEVLKADNKDECFFRYWTLKESYIKAIGMGLSYPMRDIEFKIGNSITASDNSFNFFQKKYDNYIISLATKRNIENIEIRIISGNICY